MPFPSSNRIIYQNNPLDRVICQLRFPPILRIEAEPPATFQELIRQDFSGYREKIEWSLNLPQEARGLIPGDAFQKMQQSSTKTKNHEFSSEDGDWKVNLSKSFIALTTTRYTRWEDFQCRLNSIRDALVEVFNPTYFTRVGLRYIDVIRRSQLGLDDSDWSDLIQPYILGILSDSTVCDRVINFENEFLLSLADNESNVRIKTSFARPVDSDEICYMIDSDFYNDNRKSAEEATELLTLLHQRASRLIQWCITSTLHQAMEPTDL